MAKKYLAIEPIGGGRFLAKITEGHPKVDRRFSIIRVETVNSEDEARTLYKQITGTEWKPE